MLVNVFFGSKSLDGLTFVLPIQCPFKGVNLCLEPIAPHSRLYILPITVMELGTSHCLLISE